MPQVDPDQYLRFKTMLGMERRKLPMTPAYTDRLNYELGVIQKTKFSNYFLIVADFCNWMEQEGIMFLARGSGCGSAVVWALGISHPWLDPLKYDIPFERFLNPERISNPDLDIDVDDLRRPEVFDYLRNKYGLDRVAKIITFGTLGGRQAIKDAGRTMQLPNYQELCGQIANAIPKKKGTLIADAMKTSDFLQEQARFNPDLFSNAQRIEGRVRQVGVHAGGVIIAPSKISDYTALFSKDADEENEEPVVCVQWDMYDSEDRGLLKMDLLGLNTLRIIDTTIQTINIHRERNGIKEPFVIADIPRNDPATWQMLAEGKTTGVFQVEKGFCQNFARRMNLANEQDFFKLAVFVAIIRPGMMDTGQTEAYLRRASGIEVADPMHPLLAKTFEKTFGLMCFQEDVMNAARHFAGFSVPEADTLRKGVGKKEKKFIDKMKPMWTEGAVQPRFEVTWTDKDGHPHVLITKPRNPYVKTLLPGIEIREGTYTTAEGTQVTVRFEMAGATAAEADDIWTKIEAHARYSFNNAHALAYGMVAYWTAYLKANFPIHYLTHMINAEAGVGSKEDGYNYKVSLYVEEAKSMGLQILPPCVRASRAMCSMVGEKQIRFGLSLVKKVGVDVSNYIARDMPRCDSFKEFVLNGYVVDQKDYKATEKKPARTEWSAFSKLSKTHYEQLILAGACDIFRLERAVMLEALPQLMKMSEAYHSQVAKEKNGVKVRLKSGQVLEEYNNFRIDDVEPSVPMVLETKLQKEREVTGCFLSHSPFEPFRHVIAQYQTCTPLELIDPDFEYNGATIFVGMLAEAREHITKNGKSKGKPMAFLRFVGTAGSIEMPCFPDLYERLFKTVGRFQKGSVYCVQVKPDRGDEGYQLSDMRLLSGQNVSLR